jgi:ComEC/Rec2-related protein
MTAVVLIAVMVDHRAITFRTLAVAALIVLTMAPEALVHPSFQMSFAATLGLVALVQIGMPRLFATPDHTASARAALWGGRELTMLLLASLVAGLATMPYAAFHFHRVTPYGVLANLAAMPVVSAVVMPAGLLGLVAMPFGFDGLFWAIMGVGIDWMISVTQWVAALPGAVGRVPAFGIGPLIAESRHHPARPVAHAAALVGRRAGAGSGALGGEGAAAGYSDLRRRPQCRRPRPGWKAASDARGQGLAGFVLAERVAGGGCGRANRG